MPYKRRARVLFLASDEKAEHAAHYAREVGYTWIEAQAATSMPPPPDLLSWADLVVSLDTYAYDKLPPLPPTARHVHWPVTEPHDIESRVNGMLGGMHMLQRSNPTATPS